MDLPNHQLSMTVLMTPDMANFAGDEIERKRFVAAVERKRLRTKNT